MARLMETHRQQSFIFGSCCESSLDCLRVCIKLILGFPWAATLTPFFIPVTYFKMDDGVMFIGTMLSRLQ
jgi:hypothetical protein